MSSAFLIEGLADLASSGSEPVRDTAVLDAVADRHGFTSREALVQKRRAKATRPSGQISIRAPIASINRFIEHCERERLSYGEAFCRLVAKID